MEISQRLCQAAKWVETKANEQLEKVAQLGLYTVRHIKTTDADTTLQKVCKIAGMIPGILFFAVFQAVDQLKDRVVAGWQFIKNAPAAPMPAVSQA